MELHRIAVGDIEIVGARRDADAERIKTLAESMSVIGLQTPISVWTPDDGETVRLVAGRHRLEAARLLGWDRIDCVVVSLSAIDRRLWEIAENLHRAELTVEQRASAIAEWIGLIDERTAAKPGQVAQVSAKGGRGITGGLSAATRELGIERTDAQRAVKIAALDPEAKAEARALHLDDNQSALLTAAKQPSKEEQLRSLREHAAARSAPRPQPPARDPLNDFETVERQVDSLMAAWNKAGPEAREIFMSRVDMPVADNTIALRAVK
jgi:ParB family chromosome partitioning protein